jgi:cell division protein FtsI (penicillin-binding protein 3)
MSLGNLLRNPSTATAILGGFLAFLGLRLTWVQGIRAERFRSDVDNIVEKHVRVMAPRGNILDSRGLVLAGNRATVNLVVDAKELEKIEHRLAKAALRGVVKSDSPEYASQHFEERVEIRAALIRDLAAALERSLGAKRNDVKGRAADLTERFARLRKDGKSGSVAPATYVPIAKELSPEDESEVRQILRAHRVATAFLFEEEYDRTYPAGSTAASIVGFFGYRDPNVKPSKHRRAADDAEKAGSGGIEGYFEKSLRGTPGKSSMLRAPNVPGGLIDLDNDVLPVAGADVRLTIDGTLAAILDDEARASFEQYKCDAVAAVMMEVETGRILAMASVPCFDPNRRDGDRNFPLTNYPVGFSYEPGSSVKPFTVAAALESGVISEGSEFDVNYPSGLPVPKRSKPIRDSHVHEGTLDVRGILQRSSNIGAVKIGHKAGSATVAAAFEKFGFDARARLPLPGEGRVSLPSRVKPWSIPNTLTSVSFGYEFYVTPVRLAAAYCMLANGGMRVEPRLVEEIRHPDGRVEDVKTDPARRVLPESVAASVRDMLTSVVQEEHGTAFRKADELRRQGFDEVLTFAGKTGTAVIHKDPSRMNGTFAVFGPMPKPRLVVLFVVFNSGARFGGDQVAGPALRALARSLRALGLTTATERAVNLDVPGTPPVVEVVPGGRGERNESNPRTANLDSQRERRTP